LRPGARVADGEPRMGPEDALVGADTESGPLSEAELKRRASAGIVIIGTRGLLTMLIGLAGTVVVARLLVPRDLGVVAIGMSFVLLAGLISDGGLGGSLIRRLEPPTRAELAALSALQLSITTALALMAVAVAAPFGRTGWVTAVMVASMPLVALQFPGRILLERSLNYRRLTVVELSQVFCFHGWNICTVLLGWGVWGLATGALVRAGVGALAMAVVEPAGNVRPRWSLPTIRPVLSFGLRFQAVNATWLARDQALNLGIGAVAGVAALGTWSLGRRVMEVPLLLFYALGRVSLPAMPQLLGAGRKAGPLVERAISFTAVGAGLVLAGLAGGAPGLIPGVFGARWMAASTVIPGACIGLAVGGSMTVSTQSYLFAVGDASSVLRAHLAEACAWLAITLALLPLIGIGAVGIGWAASSVVAAVPLVRATRERLDVSLVRPLLVPVLVGCCAASVGWVVTTHLGPSLWAGLTGGALSTSLFVLGLSLVHRAALLQTVSFAGRAVRAARA
jgi:O-antigen/teichoic acid export membrane protein